MRPIRAILCGGLLLALATGVAGTDAAWAASSGSAPDSSEDSASIDLAAVRERAEAMPVDLRIDMDKRIRATVDRVNHSEAARKPATLAARLAPDFGLTTDGLLDEKGRLGWTWGDMVVAQTLLTGSHAAVTLHDLESLRTGGLGWAAIAHGLQFHMEDLEDVIKSAGKIPLADSK